MELGNLLENFKTDILGAMGSQLYALQDKKRQDEERAEMSIFCPRCRTKHSQKECLLNNISICHICTEEHPTDNCPSFPGLQAIYKSGDVDETSRRPPWESRDQPVYQNFPPQSPPYYSPYQQPQQWNNPSWKSWPPHYPPPQFP